MTCIFYCFNNNVNIILFDLEKEMKTFYRTEKKDSQNLYSGMYIMTAKTTTIRALYFHVVLNSVISRQALYDIFPCA